MASTPRNDAHAAQLLGSADLSTEEGRAQVDAVLEWAESRTGIPDELRVALADARAALARGSLVRKPLEQLAWLWGKSVEGGDAIIAAVGKMLTAPSDGGTQSGGLDNPDFSGGTGRTGASTAAPAESLPAGLDRGAQAQADRMGAQAAAGVGALPPRTQQNRPGQVPGDDREAQVQALVDQGVPRELAEMLVGEGEEDENPLIGVPDGHVAPMDRNAGADLPRGERATADRMSAQAEALGRPPGSAQYRQSDTEGPFGWDAARIARLQDELVKAGLLTGEFRRGWYDAATGEAYAQALGLANQRGQNVVVALDALAEEHQAKRAEDKEKALGAFTPPVILEPDPASLRVRARQALLGIGRRSSDIDDRELDQLVSVMSGNFKRARDMEVEIARRQHEAEVTNAFADPMADPVAADLSGLDTEVDPIARFEEHFQRQFAGEIETRETGAEVARRGQQFDQGMRSMTGQVRGGGA